MLNFLNIHPEAQGLKQLLRIINNVATLACANHLPGRDIADSKHQKTAALIGNCCAVLTKLL